jgi:hypothetical protein
MLAVAEGIVRAHVVRCLAGGDPAAVRWRDGDAAVVVHADEAVVDLAGGWLALGVPMTTDQTGKQVVHAVLRLGGPGDGDGASAAFTLGPATPPLLAARWGGALRDRLWDALLDLLEAAVEAAGGGRVVGFAATNDALVVEVAR